MERQQYQGEYTEVILFSIEEGDRTEAQLVEEKERHERFRGSDSVLASMNEAISILRSQQ